MAYRFPLEQEHPVAGVYDRRTCSQEDESFDEEFDDQAVLVGSGEFGDCVHDGLLGLGRRQDRRLTVPRLGLWRKQRNRANAETYRAIRGDDIASWRGKHPMNTGCSFLSCESKQDS